MFRFSPTSISYFLVLQFVHLDYKILVSANNKVLFGFVVNHGKVLHPVSSFPIGAVKKAQHIQNKTNQNKAYYL